MRTLLRAYRGLARDLAMARRSLPDGPTRRALDGLYRRLHAELYRAPGSLPDQLRTLYAREVPAATRRLLPELAFSVAAFLVSAAIAWLCVVVWPDTAELVMSRQAMAQVAAGSLWTNELFGVLPPSQLSLQIMSNNIAVTLTAICLGLFFGFGTLWILTMNGVLLGATFAFVGQHGLATDLARFIVAHGLVEISIILLGSAIGLRLGRALARPGATGRAASLRAEALALTPLLAVLVPFLVGCGLIEGYLSPDPQIGWAVRASVGLLWMALFVRVLHGPVRIRRATDPTPALRPGARA